MLWTKTEIELRTRRIWILRTSHSKCTINVGVIRIGGELLFDAITRATGTRNSIRTRVTKNNILNTHLTSIWISALKNKTRDQTVELGVIIEARLCKLAEVCYMNRCALTVKLNLNDSLVGIKDCYLSTSDLTLWCIQWIKSKHNSSKLLYI